VEPRSVSIPSRRSQQGGERDDPSAPATLYAGTGGGVFKSSNGGQSWTAVNAGLTNTYVITLAIDPSAPATLYAGTNSGGVFRFVAASPDRQPVQRPPQKPPTRAVTPRR